MFEMMRINCSIKPEVSLMVEVGVGRGGSKDLTKEMKIVNLASFKSLYEMRCKI